MLISATKIKGLKLHASDGELGKVLDVYFDDHSWTVRYFVVRASGWLENRQVLISPASAGRPIWADHILPVKLTQEQVRNSPDVDTDAPISRLRETELVNYYGWPAYWEAPYTGAAPVAMPPPVEPDERLEHKEPRYNPNLRSLTEIAGYRIHASDGDIGHLEDLLIDDNSWTVHYLLVDTRNWLPGKRVLISPLWAMEIAYPARRIILGVSKGAIETAPAYEPGSPVTREYEQQLFEHFRSARQGLQGAGR